MNSNTSPLRDESQLSRRFQELRDRASELAVEARTVLFAEISALEAEVRSLRSQGEPVAWRAWDEKLDTRGMWVYYEKSPEWTHAEPLYASPPSQPIASDVVADRQKKALDAGFKYWRAPDAHGVECTMEQATTLLADLLGVEVEIKGPVVAAPETLSRGYTPELVEERLHAWRQRHMNRSGDRLSLEDCLQKETIDDLIDFVCAPNQSDFRGLKTGEGPQGDAATSPDILSRQSPVEADTQRSTRDTFLSDADIQAWADRNAIRQGLDELRVMLDDARSLRPLRPWDFKTWHRKLMELVKEHDTLRGHTPTKEASFKAIWQHAENIGDHWKARAFVAASPSDTSQGVSEAGERCIEWIRNNYQDHPSLSSLFDGLRAVNSGPMISLDAVAAETRDAATVPSPRLTDGGVA